MATANSSLSLTGLSFDTIRANLRNYIAAKPEFVDYDFADSAIGTLLDLLAYNTYYNAYYANMAANEGFLDTAQIYENVASRAKALGYLPLSARGASANVKLIFTASTANSTFRSITVPKDTKFTTSVNNISYVFVTPHTYTITSNSTSGFADYIKISEGEALTHRFVYNRTSNTSFVLPNDSVDTSSITVAVTANSNTVTYTLADDILVVNSSSKVFFIEADRDKRYKVSLGDGVLGNQPVTSSVVAVSYRVCSGPLSNGANTFALVSQSIDGQSSITVSSVGRATGGAEPDDIESVRFNAPRLYETQNRTVTAVDYQRILKRDNPDIDAVNAWGGEENDPPIYGKVFVCAKPKTGTTFSTTRRNTIRLDVRKYNVQSIDIEIVDPTYLYIIPKVISRYDSKLTTSTAGSIASAIVNRVIAFETANLRTFEKKFRFSRFLDYVDSTDRAIVSTTSTIRLRKDFIPSVTNKNTYNIKFNHIIQSLGTGTASGYTGYGCLTSSSFTFNGIANSFMDDDGYGTIRVYYIVGNTRVHTNKTAGTIDYQTGTVTINNFVPSAYVGEGVSIVIAPVSQDIIPIRNQIVLMSQSEVDIIDDATGKTVATAANIATYGQTATILTPPGKSFNF